MAMDGEASPLIKKLALLPLAASQTAPFPLPYAVYSGKASNDKMAVTLVTSGKCKTHGVDNVGTLHAGMMTMMALRELRPSGGGFDLVVNAGTCGGFISQGCKIGSVCIPSHSAFHDRRIEIPGTPFEEYGHGRVVCSKSLTITNKVRTKFEFLSGGCTTGDSLDHTAEDDVRMLKNEATVKDMESAAIATVCDLAGVPLLGLKVVTDLVDGDKPSFEEFLANFSTAAETLQASVNEVLLFLADEETTA